MLQRLKDVFAPSKGKAVIAAIFSFVLACLLLPSPLVIYGVVALMYGIWYTGVVLYKFSRDKQLAAQAQAIPDRPTQPNMTVMTSQSRPLYVPPTHPGQR